MVDVWRRQVMLATRDDSISFRLSAKEGNMKNIDHTMKGQYFKVYTRL